MLISGNGERQAIIEQVQANIQKRVSQTEKTAFKLFIERYFSSCAMEDLKQRSIDNLTGAVFSNWQLASVRHPGDTKIRIFNPDQDEDGWESSHTIVEIAHDDMPFLIDSIRMEINRHGYQIHFDIHFGGLKIKRDKQDRIVEILPAGTHEKNIPSEATIYIEIDRLTGQPAMDALQEDIDRVLDDVRLTVLDWHKMVARVEECLRELDRELPTLDPADMAETRDFLRWLISNNFTFLGARDYKLIGDGTNRALQVLPGSGLGVLREEHSHPSSKSYAELPPQARKMALSKSILIIAKTNTTSSVHRAAYTDYIGVKRFNEKGELIGERRFVGLYTSTAYHSSPRQIPFLRHKVAEIIHKLGFPPDSHDGKEVVHILETLPRDDLFQAAHEELLELTVGILQLQERKNIRLFVRRDAYQRYFSCLVYMPREIFNTNLAIAMQIIMMEAFNGVESSYTIYFSDSALGRLHYLIRVNPKESIEYNLAKIEKNLALAARSWSDDLKEKLIALYQEAQGLQYYAKYHDAFPASYTEDYSTEEAICDINKIETLSYDNPLALLFTRSNDQMTLRLKVFHREKIIVLSEVLPILEHMGLRILSEKPHEIKLKDESVWLNDFEMAYATEKTIDVTQIKNIFKEAFAKAWWGLVENDKFNHLVLEANLTWQETAMLRAYAKYLRQIGFALSQPYIEQALVNNADISRDIVELFKLRFDPTLTEEQRLASVELTQKIKLALDGVKSLDEDRILRRFLEVIQATLRTNYFQRSAQGEVKIYLSLKIDPQAISDLPLPRPKYEIFVYSPFIEGVHLRAGTVARGGIRWSDRREDFRTETLGLMKAQQVKNTLIVPVGAKGGFVVKQISSAEVSRDEYQKEGIRCYSTFIRGMLDITDNIQDGDTIVPKNVVRYDGDDPYLVVAADKGTATFSDIANSISQEYGFWLDDAFASGGSTGYDHKKMGITSRGVWVSVKRHFREFGINPEKDDFTVVGIGDMSGDVFGNGMLLSKHIKLLAAFNHMHIFLDPNPHPEKSYQERKRLFDLPRSLWTDYNPEMISTGGGVYNRSAKTIKISPEVKQALGIEADQLIPNELIQAILKAPVDLIWNGGIGVFVKATAETHLDAGDRTSDAIRINASELRARAIAEGGNLGMTQLARIEYSLNGGIVNTDFIDNSAGVNCSDHEVNIKILFSKLIASGEMTREQRNTLLENMTDEVAHLVLHDNYQQTQMLSLEAFVANQTIDLLRRYMNDLEKSNRLDRKLEFLPDDKYLLERKSSNRPLTRPELAMLMAYCKMYLKQDILVTDIPENPYFIKYLVTAFPKVLQDNYFVQMQEHSLRREIIATQLTKTMNDRMGINFVERLRRETGAAISTIIYAYTVAENIFQMEDLWQQIEAQDYKVPSEIQYKMMLQVYYLIRRATRWFVRNLKPDAIISSLIEDYAAPIAELTTHFPILLEGEEKETYLTDTQFFITNGVPEKLAARIAGCRMLFTSLDIVEAAKKHQHNLLDVARAYYLLGNRLELNWLRESMNNYQVDNPWDELARSSFRDDLDRVQRKLSVRVLNLKNKATKDKSIEERIEAWIKRYAFLIERWTNLLAEIRSSDNPSFVTYSVVLRELFDFAQAA